MRVWQPSLDGRRSHACRSASVRRETSVPPLARPSWGADLSGSNRGYFIQAPWLALAPGLALSFTVLGFNLFGDALRDVLDPRLRGSGRSRKRKRIQSAQTRNNG